MFDSMANNFSVIFQAVSFFALGCIVGFMAGKDKMQNDYAVYQQQMEAQRQWQEMINRYQDGGEDDE